jgi:hypothetical protein
VGVSSRGVLGRLCGVSRGLGGHGARQRARQAAGARPRRWDGRALLAALASHGRPRTMAGDNSRPSVAPRAEAQKRGLRFPGARERSLGGATAAPLQQPRLCGGLWWGKQPALGAGLLDALAGGVKVVRGLLNT